MNLSHLLIACIAAIASINALAADMGLFYERKAWNYTPQIGATTSLGLHTVGI